MLSWLITQFKNLGAFFSGNAAWLEQADKEIQEKMTAYNATMRWITGGAFVLGFIAGILVGK